MQIDTSNHVTLSSLATALLENFCYSHTFLNLHFPFHISHTVDNETFLNSHFAFHISHTVDNDNENFNYFIVQLE